MYAHVRSPVHERTRTSRYFSLTRTQCLCLSTGSLVPRRHITDNSMSKIRGAHLQRVFLHFRAFNHSVYDCNVLSVVLCVVERHGLPR